MPKQARYCGVCGSSLEVQRESASQNRKEEPQTAPDAETLIRDQQADSKYAGPSNSLREMVQVPTCRYRMGAVGGESRDDEVPPHYVRLSGFYIDRCAVSNTDYECFDPEHRRADAADRDDDPVVFVTHADCLEYCRWRSELEGLPSDAYSLPTEAQWECAARGGLVDRIYPWGNELRAELCNTRETGPLRTLPVNHGIPNPFGLFWIGSNVREWCRDWYHENYYRTLPEDVVDPPGPDPTLIVNMTVVRGASFQDPAYELGRCSARNYAHRDNSSNDVGFRCVRKAD